MSSVDEPLVAVLDRIRAHGSIGEPSIATAIRRAERFVEALPHGPLRLVDLGSGGGLPALIVAVRRPDISVTMIERRLTRADDLRRAVIGLGLSAEVVTGDVSAVADDVAAGVRSAFDVVTARSFAAPPVTARWAAALVRPGGTVVVSAAPPSKDERWVQRSLDRFGLVLDPEPVSDSPHSSDDVRVIRMRRVDSPS